MGFGLAGDRKHPVFVGQGVDGDDGPSGDLGHAVVEGEVVEHVVVLLVLFGAGVLVEGDALVVAEVLLDQVPVDGLQDAGRELETLLSYSTRKYPDSSV